MPCWALQNRKSASDIFHIAWPPGCCWLHFWRFCSLCLDFFPSPRETPDAPSLCMKTRAARRQSRTNKDAKAETAYDESTGPSSLKSLLLTFYSVISRRGEMADRESDSKLMTQQLFMCDIAGLLLCDMIIMHYCVSLQESPVTVSWLQDFVGLKNLYPGFSISLNWRQIASKLSRQSESQETSRLRTGKFFDACQMRPHKMTDCFY